LGLLIQQLSFDFEDFDRYDLNIIKLSWVSQVFSCLPSGTVPTNLFYTVVEGQGSNMTINFELFNIINYYFLKIL
jgi:hypothetical protein